jgi:hypothetical protein
MSDILMPLCQELNITYVSSTGFQSISTVVHCCKRLQAIGKPARIFYVSDADRSGRSMPPQVARQLERWQPEYAPDIEIKLTSLVLTPEQIQHYRLGGCT